MPEYPYPASWRSALGWLNDTPAGPMDMDGVRVPDMDEEGPADLEPRRAAFWAEGFQLTDHPCYACGSMSAVVACHYCRRPACGSCFFRGGRGLSRCCQLEVPDDV